MGTLLSLLDGTIVNVAIRSVGDDLNAPISTIQWVLTGYLLAFAGVIPVTGWASDRFGAKRVWIGALLLFVTASALSGAAWSVGALIGFRVLQGVAGGALPSVGQAILAQAAGPQRMGRVMGVIAVPMVFGSVAGPVIGGFVVSLAGWRWIFFVNLPLGVVAILAAQRLLPAAEPRPGTPLDVRGLVLLPSGVASLVYGVSQAGAGFGGAPALAGLGAGTVLIALYAAHAHARGTRALIDLSLLRERSFAAASALNLVFAIAMFGEILLLPLYWQVARGATPLTAGLLLAPWAVGTVVALPVGGWVTDKAGAGTVAPVGIMFVLLGTAVCTQMHAGTAYGVLAGATFVIGLGLGATNTPSMAGALATLPRAAIPRATSAILVIKQLGASVGTTTLAVVLERAINADVPRLRGSAIHSLPPAAQAQAAPALAHAFGSTFWVAFMLVALALIPALLLPRTIRRSGRVAHGAGDPAALSGRRARRDGR